MCRAGLAHGFTQPRNLPVHRWRNRALPALRGRVACKGVQQYANTGGQRGIRTLRARGDHTGERTPMPACHAGIAPAADVQIDRIRRSVATSVPAPLSTVTAP